MGHKTKSQRKSFLLVGILPMQESGQLSFIQRPEGDFIEKSELFGIFFADGHTEKQMIPHIYYKDKTIVFALIYWPQLTYSCSVIIRYKTIIDNARENKILNAADNNHYL
jgi:hypothetical protein